MKKKIKIKIGNTVQELEALKKTEDGTIYICRDTGDMYLGKLENKKDQIVNSSCIQGSEFKETSFGYGLAILGQMLLSFTRITMEEAEKYVNTDNI